MLERTLRNEVIVGFDVSIQGRLRVGSRREACLADQLADPAVKTLDHAVGLRMTRWAKAMLNVQCCAAKVEFVLPRRHPFLAGKAVSKLAAVVGQQLRNLHGGCP